MAGKSHNQQLEGGDTAQLSSSGHITLTWNGSGQAATAQTITLAGASGNVYAIITPQGVDNILLAPVPYFLNNGNGTGNIGCETKDAHSPPNGTTILLAYHIWGT